VYAERAFRTPVLSFLVGLSMLAAGLASAAGLSVAFAGDYLATLVDLPTAPMAVAFLVVIALVNARGIRESLAVNVAMTAVEITGLLLVVGIAAAVLGDGGGDPSQVLRVDGEGMGAAGAVAAATVLAFYSFVGFEVSANVAEESRDPRRSYPRALFLARASRPSSTSSWHRRSRRPCPSHRSRSPRPRCWRSCGSPTPPSPRRRSRSSPSSPSATARCSP
jgi:amino acid transporter